MSHLVIVNKDVQFEDVKLPIFLQETVRMFEDIEDANSYQTYLRESGRCPEGWGVLITELPVIPTGALDVTELKRQDALSKLSPEEKALLNLT